MSTAEFIVAELLENGMVTACASCEQETGQRTPNASHSYCKRHMLVMYADALQNAKSMISTNPKAAGRVSQLMQSIRDIKQRPDTDFPPDLQQGQAQHAAVAQ
jgi:hypothetical protein